MQANNNASKKKKSESSLLIEKLQKKIEHLEKEKSNLNKDKEKRESENELLKSIYNNVPTYLALMEVRNKDKVILSSFNKAYWDQLHILKPQIKESDVLGADLKVLIDILQLPKSESKKMYTKFIDAHTSKEIISNLEILNTKYGEMYLETIVSPILDKNNKCTHLLYSSQDISKLQQIEKILKKSNEKYKNIFDNSLIGIMRTRISDGQIIEINKKAAESYGLNTEEAKGKLKIADFYKNIEQWNEIIELLKKNKAIQGYETSHILPDGSEKIFSFSATINLEEDYIEGVAIDITQKKKFESELLKNQYYLKKAQEIGLTGTWELDLEKNNLIWTEQNYINFGVPIGTPLTYELFLNCVHPEDREYVKIEWMAALKGKPYDIEHRLLVENEVRWVREKADIEFDKNGTAIKAIGFTQNISKFKEVEKKLYESEKKYRLIIENQTDLIAKFDNKGKLTFVSPSYCRAFGKTENEFLGKSFTPLIHEDDQDRVTNELKKLYKPPYSVYIQHRVLTKEGWRWHGWQNTTLLNDKGDVVETIGVGRDITKQLNTERKITESEFMLKKAEQISHIGTWKMTPITKKTVCSDELYQIFGLKKEETDNFFESSIKLIHPDDLEHAIEVSESNIADNKSYEVEYRIILPDGTEKTLKTNGEVVSSSEGKILEIFGTVQDITEQKLSQDKLLKNQYYLQKSQEIGNIGTWELDLEKNVLIWTEENCKIFGVPPGTKVDYALFLSCVHPEDRDFVEKKWAEALTNKPYDIEHRLLVNGKVKWVRGKANIEFNEKENPVIAIGVTQDISENKKVEKQLRENAARFEAWKASNIIGIIQSNSKGDIIDANDALLSMLGYTRQELHENNLDWTKWTPKEFLHLDIKAMEEAAEKGYWTPFEKEYLHKKGHRIPIIIGGSLFKKSPAEYIVFIVDISQHKKDSQALKKSEEKFRNYVETSQDLIWECDHEGKFVYLNPAWEDVTGYKLSEMLGKPFTDFTLQEEAEKNTVEFLKHLKGGFVKGFPTTYISKNGPEINMIFNAIPLYDSDKNIIGTQGSAYDLTKQKKIQESLTESLIWNKAITDSANDAIITIDSEGFVLSWNIAAENIFGFTQADMLGNDLNDIIPQVLRERHRKGLKQLNKTGKGKILGSTMELIALNKSGDEFPIELSLSYYEINYEKFYTGIIRNITDRKEAEIEKIKLKEQLLQSQKMEAIGTLAGGIAHDFNNILGVIISSADMTLYDPTDTDDVIDNMTRIMKASERAKDMVNQILAFSRTSDHELEIINIGKLIREVISFLRSSIAASVEIRINIENEQGRIFGNATQINQVLMNLCSNAYHAMKKEGGVLEIGLRTIVLDNASAAIMNIKPGYYHNLSVSDTGIGIKQDILKKIFEPYFTTKNEGEGTGMGLAVIYGIIKSHHGGIKVDSELEKGTTFNVYFPTEQQIETEDYNYSEKVPLGHNEKILYVDDEQYLLDINVKLLRILGYNVESSLSGKDAFGLFKKNPDKFDIIITDMTMPNMSGVKLANKIHKLKPDIPVIICTGFSDKISRDNYKEHGISALIMKPVVKEEFAQTIWAVLNKKK